MADPTPAPTPTATAPSTAAPTALSAPPSTPTAAPTSAPTLAPTQGRTGPPGAALRAAAASPLFWPLLALIVLLVLDAIIVPNFLGLTILDGRLYGIPIDILKNATPTAIIALGMTLVIATRGIDLSVGATVAIAGAVATTWIAGSPDPASAGTAAVAVAVAVGLCVLLGMWNGALVSLFGISPIIATLVLMTAGRGLAQLITDGQIITVDNPVYSALGSGFALGLPIPVIIAAVLFGGVALITRRTALGMLIEAVGINPTASRLAGVRSRAVIGSVYVFVALLAGLAGLMISANVNAADANNAGLWIELDAILAVVIGGTLLTGGRYSITGTLIGALILQTLTTTVLTAGIRPEVTLVFKAVVIIAVFLLQSTRLRALLRRRRRPGPSGVLPAADPPSPSPGGAPAEPNSLDADHGTDHGADPAPAGQPRTTVSPR